MHTSTGPGRQVSTGVCDGAGLRASKTVGGVTTTFTWDTSASTPQLLSDGTTDYVYGPTGVPVEQFNASGAGGQQYYFADTHGSTVALTSSSGAVDATWTYSPWGAVTVRTGSASTPILFAGAYVGTETGLLYLQARHYDPITALFLTVDALVSLTRQAYLYTGDDPLNRTGPTGRSWLSVIAGGISMGLGIAGLATDASVVGLPVGLDLEGASLIAGGVAIAADCGGWFGAEKDPAGCALDVAAEASAGIGGVFDAVNDSYRLDEVAKASQDAFNEGLENGDENLGQENWDAGQEAWDNGLGNNSSLQAQARGWGKASVIAGGYGTAAGASEEISSNKKHCMSW